MNTNNPQSESNRKLFQPECYEDFFDPSHTALDLAAAVARSRELLSRRIWRRRLDLIGEDAFREILFRFWSDLRAGESVLSRPRALTARLNKAVDAAEQNRDGGR